MTIYGPDGMALGDVPPGPNVLTEERVNNELRQLDSLLHIRWFESAYLNQRLGRYEGRYGLCVWWPKVDKRWSMVQSGEMGEQDAFDIMGWFTEDIHDATTVPVDPEAMMHKVHELLAKADNERQPWAERMREASAHNMRQRKKIIQDAAEMTAAVARDISGIKSMRHGKKTNDPHRLDYSGLGKEMAQELGLDEDWDQYDWRM